MSPALRALGLGLIAGGGVAALSAASLIETVRFQDKPAITALLAAGPDLAARDALGNTALHWAAINGDLPTLNALLAGGADANAANTAGATPLIYAVASPAAVTALLAHGADVNHATKEKTTALLAATRRPRSAAVVRVLLAHEADFTVSLPFEGSPLEIAAGHGDTETVELLLAAGAKPHDVIGASSLGNPALVARLLDAGADLKFSPGFAGHALNFALYSNQPEIAKLLIERGADLTFRSPRGEHKTPPILWATYLQQDDPSIVQAMLAHGADPNLLSERGESALDWARDRRLHAVEAALLAAGAKPGTSPAKQKVIPSRALPEAGKELAAMTQDAIARALPLLQRTSDGFLLSGVVRQQQCVSCHQQTLPAVAFELARDRGHQLDEVSIARQMQDQVRYWQANGKVPQTYERIVPQPDFPIVVGYGLMGFAALGYPADDLTDAMAWFYLDAQLPDGTWETMDYRPPMEDGPIAAAAFGIRALQLYPVRGREAECRERIALAQAWLARAKPATFGQQLFQLLGLGWAGESPAALQPLVRAILAQQKADGGWAQLPGLDSDAWATGQALYTLATTGMTEVTDPAYRRGVAFLLRTQFDDGSWYVRSRAWPFQPQFESGFPHGKDQWISAGGTAWAAMALLLTQPKNGTPARVDWMTLAVPPPPDHLAATPTPTIASAASIDFTRDIQPILERSCSDCHGGDRKRGKFSLATRDSLLKGGQSGDPAVLPGNGADSMLIAMVSDLVEDAEMPPLSKRDRHPPLSKDEIARLRAWIDAGLPWPETASASASGAGF
jgi:ankyrin repeat protein/mono/diheme cytochrome c family protein